MKLPKLINLAELSIAESMHEKGYVYILIPKDVSIPPLYAKTVQDIAMWRIEYSGTNFKCIKIESLLKRRSEFSESEEEESYLD